MNILKITDNPDGSCDLELELTQEENNMLIEYAVTNLLREMIERSKHENNICPPIP
jgi:hypothetical protein